MRFFILILFFFFFINSALLAQGYYQQISFAQVDDFENDSENTELEDFDPEGLDEKEEINLNDTESQKKVLNSMYFSFDIGIPITFFPRDVKGIALISGSLKFPFPT